MTVSEDSIYVVKIIQTNFDRVEAADDAYSNTPSRNKGHVSVQSVHSTVVIKL